MSTVPRSNDRGDGSHQVVGNSRKLGYSRYKANAKTAKQEQLHLQEESNHVKLATVVNSKPGELNVQLSRFMEEVTMNADDVNRRLHVLEDLRSVLIKEFPHVQLHPFGSLITGLGDKGSDVDVYVDCNGSLCNGQVKETDQNQKRQVFVTVQSILRRFSRTDNRNFGQIISIASARVPIIKAVHCRTVISCDLSFENFLSVRNSRLIKLYTRIDPRVRPLLCLIRYWGKFHGLTDSAKIKNYGLNLLVLVFLAQSHIIPSIYSLQNWTPKSPQCQIEDWDASFFENEFLLLRHMHSIHGNQPDDSCLSILRLLLGFCRLYASFQAATDVVCSLTAEFIPRSHFCPGYEQELPAELNRYKEWCYSQSESDRLRVSSQNPFIIQDPFVLNYNVGGVTSALLLKKFQIAAGATADFLAKFLSSESDLRRAKVMDIFFSIEFPQKHRKHGGGENADCITVGAAGTSNGDGESEDGVLPGDKPIQRQLGFATRPTNEFCRAFWTVFSSCGLNSEEIIFRGNTFWLQCVKEFFLSFFPRCFALQPVTVMETLPLKKVFCPPRKLKEDMSAVPIQKQNGDAKTKSPPTYNSRESRNNSKEDPPPLGIPALAPKPNHNTRTPTPTSLPVPNGTPSRVRYKPRFTSTSTVPLQGTTLVQPPLPLPEVPKPEPDLDDGTESDDSSISLSTIELISAIIANPSPREILDALDVTTYRPQRITFQFSGAIHNNWKGRGSVAKSLTSENWSPPTTNPMEIEAEITHRLIASSDATESTPIDVAFDCGVTFRPESFRDVSVEVQLRESHGLRVLPLMQTLKAVMLDTLPEYCAYSLAEWTSALRSKPIESTVARETKDGAKEKRKKRKR